ncbi:MAG: hypothetical protein JST39_18620, partial [Bacteroidetes bacterium]|nr:hypothetical protein [Bacteroidota bacterium]
MKKWFIGLLVLIALSLAAVYIFIPRTLDISSIAYAHCPAPAADRYVSGQLRWDTLQSAGQKADSFIIVKRMYNSVHIFIHAGGIRTPSILYVLPISPDSVALQWSCSLSNGNSPFARIAGYRQALALKKTMRVMLDTLAAQLNDDRHVYGYSIKRTSTVDTLLVS